MAAVHRALDLIRRLEDQMTSYREESDLSRVNRLAHQAPVKVPEELFEVLSLGWDLYSNTGGAFDPTAGPLSRCWGFYRRQGRVPSPEELGRALEGVGYRHVELNRGERSVLFERSGVELNLGGIGKGYALDCAARYLEGAGLRSMLLHGGYSTCLARGDSPAGPGWQVSLRHPFRRESSFAVVTLKERALSTSGAGEQSFRAGNRRFGHILDPRSGQPAGHHGSVTVVAPTAAEADALSTAFFVMSTAEVEHYCRRNPQIGALLVLPEPDEEGPLAVHQFGANGQYWEVES